MVWKTDKSYKNVTDSEIGTIRKQWKGRIKVALVYPNVYHIGMSNLGFQTVYDLLNTIEHVVCERAFLPDDNETTSQRIFSIESGNPLSDFDIIAFSVSFENDYPNILTIIERSGLPLLSVDRENPHPLVIAGGVVFFSNPEPVAPFIDCFLIGEAEVILPQFFETDCLKRLTQDKEGCLKTLAQNVPGTYVPQFYKTTYHADGTLEAFKPMHDVPDKVKRRYLEDLNSAPTCSAILTPDTTFENTYLIEVGRGCPHGCRFCSAGFVYRPPRFRHHSIIDKCLKRGESMTDHIGLVGAAVTDFPDFNQLCSHAFEKETRISFSSLRANALSPELISILRRSKTKTATIAPDAGSERMRKVINKGITEADIINAAETLVAGGIPNLKLYFMIGLPTETMDDVEAIVSLCKKIKHRFLKSSRAKKRIGEITVSLNSFVPKPFTPFQWVEMDDVKSLKKKIKKIKEGLKRIANVRVHSDVPRWAYIQALLSRGDRKVAQILLLANQNSGNWPKTLKASPVNPDFYVYRERTMGELFPWEFIDNGINKSFLKQEYDRALQGKTSPPCPMESCHICGVCDPNFP